MTRVRTGAYGGARSGALGRGARGAGLRPRAPLLTLTGRDSGEFQHHNFSTLITLIFNATLMAL